MRLIIFFASWVLRCKNVCIFLKRKSHPLGMARFLVELNETYWQVSGCTLRAEIFPGFEGCSVPESINTPPEPALPCRHLYHSQFFHLQLCQSKAIPGSIRTTSLFFQAYKRTE